MDLMAAVQYDSKELICVKYSINLNCTEFQHLNLPFLMSGLYCPCRNDSINDVPLQTVVNMSIMIVESS